MTHQTFLSRAQAELKESTPVQVLIWAAKTFPGSVTLATALGPEAQSLTHLLAERQLDIDIFTLDTGRHFEETHHLLAQTNERYAINIKSYFPHAQDVEHAVTGQGPYAFRDSVAARKHCCHIRKVKPLLRALSGYEAWITGLRRDQSPTRDEVKVIEWDEAHSLYKINPLWNWTGDQVWSFIKANDVPFNSLHNQNYTSIGCAPCTRAVAPGEDPRAGRWWWETPETKECGIHLVNGQLRPRSPKAKNQLTQTISV